ncbi:BlaI/MecI/CopY family transcriptional regulator [Desulfosporosinus nitroreducens]|uniref:BlaI/MecI/CopY family transcriptional regulator n=1 Tax=Desulfosporosinus nitroreducens TaxID=2018668 RepID=A0ABT8QT24_9FIRM|nr:BlaI/MecI/CopY family transcriptional regulator [Desulfosporosinus nitroreducens]MDO0824496.1 BlaI/MecI/CopY family transcriptional regulator [Desulfosporosinus nitroreducens]
MEELARISDAEWYVMQVLWESSDVLTSNQIIEKLIDKHDWKPKTIQTLIGRLVKKKAVGFKEMGRTYQYYPLVTKESCIRAESKSFLQRAFGGAIKPMFLHFLEEQNLSTQEIDELKKILNERSDKR